MPSWRHSLAACVLIADSAQGFATFPQTSTFARLRGGTLACKGNAVSAMGGRKTLRQHVRTSWRCQLPEHAMSVPFQKDYFFCLFGKLCY